MPRVMLTGGLGFIGSSIAAALAQRPKVDLTMLVRQRPAGPLPHARIIEVELTDERGVKVALREVAPDAVIHAAGRVHGSPLELYRDNTFATIVLTEALLEAQPAAILTTFGSAAEYGNAGIMPLMEESPCRPAHTYGHVKLATATYLAAAAGRGLRYNLLRLFNPVGIVNSQHQVLGAFLAQAAAVCDAAPPHVIRMGRLDAVRDFVVVDDLVQLVINFLELSRLRPCSQCLQRRRSSGAGTCQISRPPFGC